MKAAQEAAVKAPVKGKKNNIFLQISKAPVSTLVLFCVSVFFDYLFSKIKKPLPQSKTISNKHLSLHHLQSFIAKKAIKGFHYYRAI
jgi:hypothetical protein